MRIFLKLLRLVGLVVLTIYLLTTNPDGKKLMMSIIQKFSNETVTTRTVAIDKLVEVINKYRADKKLPILIRDNRLDKASEARLAVIQSKDDFDGRITGVTLEKSAINNGYNYSLVGGLYSAGSETEESILENWKKDDGARKILEDKYVRQIGLAMNIKESVTSVVVIVGKEAGAVVNKNVSWGGPELWEAVNKRRTERGVSSLSRKEELCTIASIRLNQLLELGKLDGHAGFVPTLERSDLKWIKDKYDISEFLVTGYSTPLAAVDAWEHTLGHKDLLTGGQFVWGCIYAQNTFGVAITAF